MSDIRQAKKTLIARILEGDGAAPDPQRRAAFDNAGTCSRGVIDENQARLAESTQLLVRIVSASV